PTPKPVPPDVPKTMVFPSQFGSIVAHAAFVPEQLAHSKRGWNSPRTPTPRTRSRKSGSFQTGLKDSGGLVPQTPIPFTDAHLKTGRGPISKGITGTCDGKDGRGPKNEREVAGGSETLLRIENKPL